jgi:hypothetical protein
MSMSPRGRFDTHRKHSHTRGIPFLLTFEEWWSIWQASGHYDECGTRRGQFVMARFKDRGPYSENNVRICTVEENHAEKKMSAKARARIAAARKERGPCSAETKAKLAAASRISSLGRKCSEEKKAKISAANMGHEVSVTTRAKIGAVVRAASLARRLEAL